MDEIKKKQQQPKVRDFVVPNEFDTEKTIINDEFWITKNLVEKSKNLVIFDLDLLSIDLGVMPWCCSSILHFTGHMLDVNKSNIKYPIILSPSGWVVNGWHRIVKAILKGEKSIPAVRFVNMPEPDGREKQNE